MSALTVLMIIGGIIDLGVGAFSLVVASLYLSWLGILAGVGPTGLLLSLVSFGSFIAGILSFILAYGLWKGRGWAWTWTFIFSILGLIISVIGIAVGIGIIGIVIYAVIIYYLTRARVYLVPPRFIRWLRKSPSASTCQLETVAAHASWRYRRFLDRRIARTTSRMTG